VQALRPSFSLISLGGNSSPFEPTRLSCIFLVHRIITCIVGMINIAE
jgi:hypothetical protein